METETRSAEIAAKRRPPKASPLNGQPVPKGRAKGTPNRVTATIREAIEAATRPGACHPQGLTGWLIERANGSLGDRQIFAAMVAKALPLQVQAQGGSGGVTINLGWLAGRGLINVTPTAQPTHNLLIEHGNTRTTDQRDDGQAAIDHQADEPHPHPPIERQEGGG